MRKIFINQDNRFEQPIIYGVYYKKTWEKPNVNDIIRLRLKLVMGTKSNGKILYKKQEVLCAVYYIDDEEIKINVVR